MLKINIVTGLFFSLFFSVYAETWGSIDQKVNVFLKKHVADGKVNYAAIKKSPKELNELIKIIAATKLSESKNERMSFYINAYNILVIKGIVSHYPVEGPLKIDGFFDREQYQIAGEHMTLNDLENKKIRVYKDARIHFALVCAAISCPSLTSNAYTPKTLNTYLQRQAEKALNDDGFIRVKSQSKAVYVSEIFKWYKEDFGTSDAALLRYINQYRRVKIPSSYELKYYPYSWKLNKK